MISQPEDNEILVTSHGPALIVSSVKQIDPALWKSTFYQHYLDSRYYTVLEETLRDRFDYRYAILTHAATGSKVVQPFFFTDQEITGGLPGWFQNAIAHVPFISRWLTTKMAVIGCAAGEGCLASTQRWTLESLEEAVAQYARKNRARLLLFKEFPVQTRIFFQPLARRGYQRIASMPGTGIDLDFLDFDEYLQRKVGHRFRSDLRHKLRESEKSGSLALKVISDVSPFLDEIYPLYLQTYTRSSHRFEKLSREYFSRLGQDLPEQTRFFLWRQDGKLLAFALCLIHHRILHYLNIGMDYPTALDRHLYYVVWRDLVSWAITEKLQRIETGSLNYEAKFRLGMQLLPLDLYVRHLSPALNPILIGALRFLQPTRYDPALKKFPNANSL